MKRHFDKNKHQMTEWEKENLWLAIDDEVGSAKEKKRIFGWGWLPAAGGTTVLAAMVLTMFLWTDNKNTLVDTNILPRTELTPITPTVDDKYSIGRVEEGIAKQAGIDLQDTMKSREEGRRADVSVVIDGESNENIVEAAPEEVEADKIKHTINSETFEKYAIDSVEEGVSKQAGVDLRDGQIYHRGGRSRETSVRIDGVALKNPLATAPAPKGRMIHPGSITGGESPPNGEKFELMYFEHTGVNPFLPTEEDSLSTFAVDVDNASWNMACNYLNRGSLPPKSAIRVEEFVNAFTTGLPEYRRPQNSPEAFSIHIDGGNSPFGKGYQLMRVSLVGESVNPEHRKPASLIFVIDTSGSMRSENRLEMVKDALNILLGELQEGDTVGIVTYGSCGTVVLEPTDISRRPAISAAINSLQCGGSTNAEEGLQLAYRLAREHFQSGIVNRLILCSDGVANVGRTEANSVLSMVRTKADQGIALSAIGFGMGNYNDIFMEQLANNGDGNYYYVDTLKEAERVFKENLTGTLQTIARDVKIQVAFDPITVERWRLLGYENRDVADNDFRNDKVDAGEIGAGHQVTALYEIKMKNKADTLADQALGTVRVRHEGPAHDIQRAGQVIESSLSFSSADVTMELDLNHLHLRAQILVAEFAEILRGSYWARDNKLQDLVPLADELARQSGQQEQIQKLAKMIRKAASLAAESKN